MKMGGGSHEAWRQRLRSGSAQALMARDIGRLDGERAIANFADWTDRIAKGELPFDKPRAAAGHRAQPGHHDVGLPAPGVLPARRGVDRPAQSARESNGPVYGSPEDSTDIVPVVDPRAHRAIELPHPVRDASDAVGEGQSVRRVGVLGRQALLGRPHAQPQPDDGRARAHLVHLAHQPGSEPDWCKAGSDHPSAKAYPLNGGANRHLSYYDPWSRSGR